MGEIKSALELALEKTQDIKSNKAHLEAQDINKEGRRMATRYLSNPDNEENDIRKQLDAQKDEAKMKMLKQGVLDALMANLVLPQNREFADWMGVLTKAFGLAVKDRKKVDSLFKQLEGFFIQYLDNREKIQKSLEAQFAPRLKQKEEQLSKQMGSKVKINPSQDPEFINFLKGNLGQLEEQYRKALDEAKLELKKLAEA
ncbi:MAG: hypothetical protein E4H36_13750 [Spirochaetales bacterium]|nr:MAG: hypothetical protein E4H36_13750 [Spirochaetales bacterium]